MRCENIKISLEIPVRPNQPDCNGVIYTEDAIYNACKKGDDLPIVIRNIKGESVAVGTAKTIDYKNGTMLVEGYLFHSGTDEQVEFNDNKEIVSMEISAFGICE
jgi:hypothetical protein